MVNFTGSLEFAALDSVPENLIDNAAILGTLTLVTAALFLLDMGGPKSRNMTQHSQTPPRSVSKPDSKSVAQQVYEMEKEIDERRHHHPVEIFEKPKAPKNGTVLHTSGLSRDHNGRYRDSMYKKIRDENTQKSFDIYGKDIRAADSDTDDAESIPPKMDEHSPVWSKIRKGRNL